MAATNELTFTAKNLQPAINPGKARTLAITLAPGQYYSGQTVGQHTADANYTAYASANTDGSQVAKGFLKYDTYVDANGLHYLTDNGTVTSGTFGTSSQLSTPMYYTGDFFTADLVTTGVGAVDANAITNLQAHFVAGNLTNGTIHIG